MRYHKSSNNQKGGMQMLGIYIHIPFCLSKCPYCDFYSLPYREELAQQYVQAAAAGG